LYAKTHLLIFYFAAVYEEQDTLHMDCMDEGAWSLLVLSLSSSDFLIRMTDEDETTPALRANFHEQ
jgi:hypothetical protein